MTTPSETSFRNTSKTYHELDHSAIIDMHFSDAEGWGGVVARVRLIILRQNKYFLRSPLGAQTTTFVVRKLGYYQKGLDS